MTARLFSFGVLADVQYADVDDAWNYTKTSKRFYRAAKSHLEAAVDAWVVEAATTPIRFAVNLGDLLDGKNAPMGQSQTTLALLRKSFDVFQNRVGPVHHCLGNHELYNFSRDEYLAGLVHHTSSPHASTAMLPPVATPTAYYTFSVPGTAYRFVVLDPYDRSVLGSAPGSAAHQSAKEFLIARNPNADLNSSEGLEGPLRRFVEYNGAVDTAQLVWLEETLRQAQTAHENVVLFSHVPLHPESCHPACLLWNYDEVLAVIAAHCCVRAVLCGHYHDNGYAQDAQGVHFVNFQAVLEAPANAYATIDVFSDRLHIRGVGNVPTRELAF
ncbi:hypothetical protein ACHHYP_13363 [Achlya hypogyna]|uniref:Calcineurin-like phosphoesterase domain-containing protein n=1 Tax=Achlya hypogyna TaxID=1202772 RepID=A0A1V9YFH3_ACHHY|nr:hypothetical protein ACHHYP_13363 [Achlya hypogyna]